MNPEDHYILVITAVASEMQDVMDCLESGRDRMIGNRSIRCGRISGIPVRLIVTGPGMGNTIQGITACVENARPDLMIQTGCGGGFRQSGVDIGDVVVAASEVDIHLGIESDETSKVLQDLPFSVFSRNGTDFKGLYPLNAEMAEKAFLALQHAYAPQSIGVFKGLFITGSTITGNEQRANALYSAFSPCIESMEGSGAAFLSHYYQIPLIEIRCASNFVGRRDRSKWSLSLACSRAGESAVIVLRSSALKQTTRLQDM